MTAARFDPDGRADPAELRVTGWAWYELDSMLFLVATDAADPDRRPALMGGTPPPFWRISDLARTVELGEGDPWRQHMAHELLAAVMADLAADPGLR
jgi:hypothetical protein